MIDGESVGLFGRLKATSKQLRRKPRGEKRVAEQVTAIKQQIRILLNSRKGSSASTPEFGLADFNDAAIGSSDMVSTIVEDVRHAIARYEPRLVVEHIQCAPNQDLPLVLDFHITGHILAEDAAQKVEIDMVLNGFDRRYTVL
jgi:type VI secretion system protein